MRKPAGRDAPSIKNQASAPKRIVTNAVQTKAVPASSPRAVSSSKATHSSNATSSSGKRIRTTPTAFDRSLLTQATGDDQPEEPAAKPSPAPPMKRPTEPVPQPDEVVYEDGSYVDEGSFAPSYEEYEPQNGYPILTVNEYSPLAMIFSRLYLRAEATTFWASGQPLPTLVTGGATGNTDSLFGGRQVGMDSTQGLRFDGGLWLDPSKSRGVLVRVFDAGENDLDLNTSSAITPFIARPFQNLTAGANQDPFTVSSPGIQAGSVAASLSSRVMVAMCFIVLPCLETISGDGIGLWGTRPLD